MLSAKQGSHWYHFYDVFGMTRPGIDPTHILTYRTRSGRSTTWAIAADEDKDEDSTETCCDRHLEIPGVSNNTTGTLEQKKTNSWTPMGQATDKKAPAQTN